MGIERKRVNIEISPLNSAAVALRAHIGRAQARPRVDNAANRVALPWQDSEH
jgi:hypothetical protein